jgi:hypothetical protein
MFNISHVFPLLIGFCNCTATRCAVILILFITVMHYICMYTVVNILVPSNTMFIALIDFHHFLLSHLSGILQVGSVVEVITNIKLK